MRDTLHWFITWLVLTLSTTGGWLIAWFVSMSTSFASAIWDPDEIEAYLSLTPWQHLFNALLIGAMFGVMVAIAVALAQFALRRKLRSVIVTAAAVVFGSALLCVIVQVGPIQVNESSFLAMFRIGFGGGVVGGAIAGWIQWLLLHRQMKQMNGWVLGTVLSWAIAFGLLMGWTNSDQIGGNPAYMLAMSLLSGALAGVGPAWILRRNVSRAVWLIPASALSWGAAGLYLTSQADVFLAPVLVGILTASAMVALIYYQTRRTDSTMDEITPNSGS